MRDDKKYDHLENLTLAAFSQNPESELQAEQLQSAINDSITAMPEKRGMVFEMCFIRKFTYREAAEAFDVSERNV